MGDLVKKAVEVSTFGLVDFEPPKPKPPVTMPDEDQLKKARRRRAAKRMNKGRSSTILSQDRTDQLGPG